MPPKGKKGRGKTLDINQFNKDVVDDTVLDWAEDDWNQNGGGREGQQSEAAEQGTKSYRQFSRTANNALGGAESFRTAARVQPEALLNELKPPFVAHFGNIRNGTTEQMFLKLFDEDVVVQHHLVNQAGKSFAFVEFATAEALRFALMLHNTYQRGRLLYVDLATPQQVDRLMNRTTGARGPGDALRDGTRPQSRQPTLDFTRDVFGAQQPQPSQQSRDFGSPLSGAGASRSNFGSKADLHGLDELSRDLLGSAVQPTPANKPPTAPVPLANWRSEAQATPTTMPDARRDTDTPSSPTPQPSSPRGRGRRGNERPIGSPHAVTGAPATASFANWRDEPRAEQVRRDDTMTTRDDAPRNAPRGRGRGTAHLRNSDRPRSPKPTRGDDTDPAAAAPATGDKWADLRR